MQPADIRTVVDFRRFVFSLVETTAKSYHVTLESYLSALWLLIQQHRTTPASYALFGQLLEEAFTSTPPPFDEQWLSYRTPPEELALDPAQVTDAYLVVQKLLLYQIADLHRMRAEGLLDQPGSILHMGVTSPTGETWYHFSPVSFLFCASSVLPDELGVDAEQDHRVSICTWSELARFLWLGQIYE